MFSPIDLDSAVDGVELGVRKGTERTEGTEKTIAKGIFPGYLASFVSLMSFPSLSKVHV